MDSLVKLVGSNIKQIRKSKELTQDELAEKCGLQTSYITLQTLEKIIAGLGVSANQIFNFSSINSDQIHLKKQDFIMLLNSLIEDKSEQEVRLILNLATEIFNTYK